MDKDEVLSTAQHQLSNAIAEFQCPPCNPLPVTPWTAMSLLQKTIRRGCKELAIRAAATLFHGSPERRGLREYGDL
jgi:hypothetical protein